MKKESQRSTHFSVANNAKESLTSRAYREIEELIVMLELKPGEVLSESLLSNRLGIGRTPVREALQRLHNEGLVSIIARRGVLVSEINLQRQLELLRVRREVERLMARLAAARSNQQERATLNEIAEAMAESAKSGDVQRFVRLDRDLNDVVAQCCRNEFARKSMGLMHGLARRFWFMHYAKAKDLPRGARLHVDYARVIAKGNPDKAAAASDRLMDYFEEFTRSTLDVGGFDTCLSGT